MNAGPLPPVPIVDDSLTARADLEQASAAAAPATILVIDDCATFRGELAEALRARGYAVAGAASGEEGLRSIGQYRPAAVLVDAVLPGIDGHGVVRKLRLDAALRHLPCILLTASERQGAELNALDSGADAFVRKDEGLAMILARLEAVLRKAGDGACQPAAGLLGATRILAVDDSPSYLRVQAEVLLGEGYDVILAHSGEEALRMVRAQAVDCILLDRIMPGLGGTETCRRLKADPATRDIPLIMLTAMEDRDAMIEGLSIGADDYVLKSSEFDVLKARVRAQLRRKQFEDDRRRVRAELGAKEREAAEMRAARALADSRAELLAILEQKNRDLELAVRALQERQGEIDEKNRQLEEASRLKSEFLSNMSHELRTPLNAIIGFSDLLRGGVVGPLSERQQVCVGHVVTSGKHLLALINDILDLSKVEAGKMELELEPVQPDALLRGCLSLVLEGAAKRAVTFAFEPCGELEAAMFDLRKLKQIAYNLLSNAVKFSADGGQVTLSAHRLGRAGVGQGAPAGMTTRVLPLPPGQFQQWLEIRVRDHGIGVNPDDMRHLFQSFRQLDSSMARHHEGSGLGLALVSRMAALHGGTVGVASGAGMGSQFSVWLPWRALAGPGAVEPPRGRRVLVIEDDVQAAALLRLHFESIGFEVALAADAASALALAEHGAPDLITLDLVLPGASGWDVLEQLKANPLLGPTPVLLVSLIAEELKACALGAAQLLQKPIQHQALIDAVYALGLVGDSALAPTVLLVDEDAAASARVAALLGGLNYKVLCAPDGHSAIALARSDPPDLIIVDLLLPDISGFELIDALRLLPETAGVPALVLSGDTVGQAERVRLNGQVVRIMKKGSFNRQQLLREVNRALQQHDAAPDPR
ncbi:MULTISPECIES: response regulator [unclassified Janthinobacterium]|uniref:response regulator n=1 Tax=unclassified Janthinobacterium TaxID=2610881 RepID=UPI00034DB930|nr:MULTISPECIES: response regulator [unclassified Janthinobacterium]MEC5162363.1 DNA-binding response OmpR family regulator/anti-sigma regulatory factor (Ser/Thr protein kinase) [Janthinobacterium sp. CG_S6]